MDLLNPPFPAEELALLLSTDELARVARFRFPHLQERFRIGRGMLRHLLAKAGNMPAERLCFAYSAEGKPMFPGMHFNVSHSGDLWACAISRNSPVGLDIEQVRPMADYEALALRFFSSAEYQAIALLPEPKRRAAFFRCWTRKESYIKGLGEGLSRGLATFTVSCGQEEISLVEDTMSSEQWIVESFVPAPGYAGALATQVITR